MPNPSCFPLVRGRTMRVTKVDGCCAPDYGPDNMVVTEGFVSVALTANINEAEEILITNATGKTCVRDPGSTEFQGYGVEITFCEVSPCLFSIVTGQPAVVDANGDVVGFRMNSAVSLTGSGFALEVWMGVPGVACSGEAGAYGYLLLPCLQGGVVGDFTIENAAITFTVTGASTKDGNGWGTGPYNVVADTDGTTATNAARRPRRRRPPLRRVHHDRPTRRDRRLRRAWPSPPPPAPSPERPAHGPRPVRPHRPTSPPPTRQASTRCPRSAAWTTGQYVQGSTAGASGEMNWNGTAWVTGRHAVT